MESAHQFSFRPDCNSTALCALLFQQSHLFLICVVLKDLEGFAKFPSNDFWTSYQAPRTFAAPFGFPAKLLFCTDVTESIGWASPAPRLQIDDCFEIHNFH